MTLSQPRQSSVVSGDNPAMESESRDDYAPDWTKADREQWKADYAAGRAVLLPHPGHDEGECEHCDVLRRLMWEADGA